jgi:hypothetical protein
VIWVLAGGLLAVLVVSAGWRLRRRYQDYRIRQHRHRTAWGEYKRSRGGPR